MPIHFHDTLEAAHYSRSKDGGHLEINNITLSQAGEYECIAKTSVGRIAAKTNLFVYGPPGAVGGVQVKIMCYKIAMNYKKTSDYKFK